MDFKPRLFKYWVGSHFINCMCILSWFVPESVSILLCVDCRHFSCLMSLFQSHIACRNFTPTGPPSTKGNCLFKMQILSRLAICKHCCDFKTLLKGNTLHIDKHTRQSRLWVTGLFARWIFSLGLLRCLLVVYSHNIGHQDKWPEVHIPYLFE